MSNVDAASSATFDGLGSYLIARYGLVMTGGDLAAELKTSTTALRIARHRGRDLPEPAPLPGRGRRWRTTDVAAWITSLGTPTGPAGDGRLDVHSSERSQRRSGRPRKIAAATSAKDAQGGAA